MTLKPTHITPIAFLAFLPLMTQLAGPNFPPAWITETIVETLTRTGDIRGRCEIDLGEEAATSILAYELVRRIEAEAVFVKPTMARSKVGINRRPSQRLNSEHISASEDGRQHRLDHPGQLPLQLG
jgi:hypothetical protein